MRPKDQGTDWEREGEAFFKDLGYTSEMLRQRGANDVADIRVVHPDLGVIYVEMKHRSNFNPILGLKAARAKVNEDFRRRFGSHLSSVAHVVVMWKRSVLKEGNTRRSQEGPPIVVMSMEFFAELLRQAEHAGCNGQLA